MFSLRRAVLRAAASPTTAVVSKPRSFVTFSSTIARQQIRLSVSPFQRRFRSEQVASPSDVNATDETLPLEPSAAGETSAAEDQLPQEHAVADAVAQQPVEASSASPGEALPFPPSATDANKEELSRIVYVGNLFFEVTENDLIEHFEARVGPVGRAKIASDPRGLSKGFGWMEFKSREDATKAVQELDQSVFQGRRMVCQFQRGRPISRTNLSTPRAPNPPSKTLFVGNMSFDMSDKDLNDLFRPLRNVLDVRVAVDRRTGQPRGFAHCDFIDEESATKALGQLSDKEVYGRKLRVDYTASYAR